MAIGEHLLLGGDNLDLALAALVEKKLTDAARLTLADQRQIAAPEVQRRERSAAVARRRRSVVTITVLGSGRGVVGGGMTTELTRAEVDVGAARGIPAADAS